MSILKEEAAAHFPVQGTLTEIIPFGGGHINDTFKLTTDEASYILQRINKYVFKKPEEIMENIIGVTSFIREKITASGGDPLKETLNFIPADDGRYYYIDSEGEYWRAMLFIENSTAYDFAKNSEMLAESGFAFGQFQNYLSDYPADTLHEVIKDFHNTPVRCKQLQEAVKKDKAGRADTVTAEIKFAHDRLEDAGELMRLLEAGKLPLKVTHNDTKMSNVLIDNNTDRALCVIDLDTVMPGLAAFDFGDSIRAGASTAAEDEADLSKVNFSLELYEAYTGGYLKAAGKALSREEILSLPVGAKLMTFEVGIRFLADYLNGDVYFKTKYPEHNLVRARNQFKLVSDMENKWNEIMKITEKYI